MASQRIRVLLTNDDGPPGRDSPYIYGFARHLAVDLGWDVKVVIPSTQKSWIGKAFHIKDIVNGRYYYPRDPVGFGESSAISRPLNDGEFAEWILLDATPATCANIALHNLYHGDIDLVISGPNLGRNSSSAFALSSGTIGAALSSSLSSVRSIALSYGTVVRPTPESFFRPAHILSGRIISQLWEDWGRDPAGLRNGEVDLYNINLPMIDALLKEEAMRVVWTHMWKNAYGSLFKSHEPHACEANPDVAPGGPDAQLDYDKSKGQPATTTAPNARELSFKFSPDANFIRLINPLPSSLPVGCDAWAISQGWASITPLRASFAEPGDAELYNDQQDGLAAGSDGEVIAPGVKAFKLKL